VIVAFYGFTLIPNLFPQAAPRSALPVKTLTINRKPLTVEMVSLQQDVEQGLSDRSSMPPDRGMLFVFKDAQTRSFWMQRMHFPLDILFIRNNTVVEMARNLPPPATPAEPPATYNTKETADRVLEINAGQSEAYGLQVGSTIPDLP